MAGDRGFEPRHTDPESAVLPLDESPAIDLNFTMFNCPRQIFVSIRPDMSVQYISIMNFQEKNK
jgi:hypothetical protein